MMSFTKTFISLMILAVACGSAQACGSHDDDWTGSDKLAHFGVSAVLGVGASRVSDDTLTAFGLALVPGVAKELYDTTRDCNRFSWKDMAWNAAGAFVGVKAGNWILGPSSVGYRLSF